MSLKEAREKRDEARKQIGGGIDPGELRKLTKLALINNSGNTFEVIAREWHGMYSEAWQPEYAKTVIHRLETDAFPWIGSRPVSELRPLDALAVLRVEIQKRGALETAHRRCCSTSAKSCGIPLRPGARTATLRSIFAARSRPSLARTPPKLQSA